MRHNKGRPGRRAWRRPPPSLVFLLLGILLLVGAAYQALGAGRTQRLTVARVLQSYAGVAAWNFEQYATLAFRSAVEDLFHPLHTVSFEHGARPYGVDVLLRGRTDLATCGAELVAATRYAVRFALRGSAIASSIPVNPAVLDELRAEVREHYERTTPRDRLTGHELAYAFALADTAALVLYSPKLVPGDTLVYALVLDPARLAPAYERILSNQQLLPEPLVGGADNRDLLALSLRLPDGGSRVYGDRAVTPHVAEQPMPKLGGLIAVIELQSAAVERLIPAGSPFMRGPFLIALLSVAIGLLVVAFSQVRREYALARLRSDFVSSVSHELRTPLALQRVFLDMLRLGRVDTPERSQWCFENIDRESVRLAHLVENVLHFTRAEQGTMRVTLQRATLAPLVQDIVHAFEPLAAGSHVRIVCTAEPGLSAPIDPSALRQIVMNLLENAVKYGGEGRQITVTLQQGAYGTARLTVDDEGAGIPHEERDAVFQPFHRGAGTLNTAVAGSGIGLAVVRELVRRHGGRVFVSDAPGGGARFVVELPGARREPALEPGALAAREPAHEHAGAA